MLGPRKGWQEVVVLFAVYQLYTLVRGQLPEPAGAAFAHAHQIIDVERALGIFHEESIQDWFLGSRPLVRFWNVYYGTVHFVVPVVVLVLLWRRDPARYRKWRNAGGFMLVVGLAGFALWPLAPPRLLPPTSSFVDTKVDYGGIGPFGGGGREDANRFAAMPSLHSGWSAWCAFAAYPVLRRRWSKALIVAYPVVTLLAIVVTGNHYVLDAVGGWLALAVGVALATLIERKFSPPALTSAAS